MQNVEGWPAKGHVRSPGVDVAVGGKSREVVSASVSASVRGNDVSARTGRVEWKPSDPVFRRQDSVLTPLLPRRGDRVEVRAGEGDALARVLTGKIDATGVEVPGGVFSDLADDFDMLSEEVDIPSLMATMPPATDEDPLIRVGLTASWPTQRALSEAGFYATPPPRIGAYMSASLNGSLWPEFGTIRKSATQPTWTTVPWGQAASGFTATYTGVPGTMADHPLEVSFMPAPGEGRQVAIRVRFPDGEFRVGVGTSGSVSASMSAGSVNETPVSLSGVEVAGGELVRLRVSASGAWELSCGSVTKTATAPVPAALQGEPDDVYINSPYADSRPIGGVNVGYYTTTPRDWVRTVEMDPPDGALAASRAIVSTPARSILQDRAAAEGARMWIDAHGVFHWRSLKRWGTGDPVLALTDVDLLGYSLGMDYDSTYSGVTVSCLVADTEARDLATITLYQGTRDAMGPGDVNTVFIEPPQDEDWPKIDNSLDTLGNTGYIPGFNRGRRSWQGAVRVSEDGTVEQWPYGSQGHYVDFRFETITLKKWLHVTTVRQNLPPGEVVETRSVDRDLASSGLWKSWGNFNLPVIRGYARVAWVEEKRYATNATTQTLPRLEHDCSWWVQGAAVQRLTDGLAARYASPVVTITGLSIVPDARIEIGDVITITDSTFAGLSARVVVTGVNLETRNGAASMSLDVEVLSINATTGTYADVQARADSSTYAQFQALIGAVTYREQEAE